LRLITISIWKNLNKKLKELLKMRRLPMGFVRKKIDNSSKDAGVLNT